MKSKGLVTGILFVVLVIVTVGIRFYYINYLMVDVSVSEEIYNLVKITSLSSVFDVGVKFSSVYAFMLYCGFYCFGNFTVAGVYLNILFQTLTVIIVFGIIGFILNRYVAFGVSIVLSAVPVYFYRVSVISDLNMRILVIVLAVAVLAIAVKLAVSFRVGKGKNKAQVAPAPSQEVIVENTVKETVVEETDEKKVKFLDNPLPVPKRRKHKEMDFAVSLDDKNNDYDIKDVSGKDFYDID